MCNTWAWCEDEHFSHNCSEILRRKESQHEHNFMHLWSALLSFMFHAYSVTKSAFIKLPLLTFELFLTSPILHLEILALMGLPFIIQLMLLGQGGHSTRFLVLWVVGRPDNPCGDSIEPCVTVKHWPGVECWRLLVWNLSDSLRKEKVYQ